MRQHSIEATHFKSTKGYVVQCSATADTEPVVTGREWDAAHLYKLQLQITDDIHRNDIVVPGLQDDDDEECEYAETDHFHNSEEHSAHNWWLGDVDDDSECAVMYHPITTGATRPARAAKLNNKDTKRMGPDAWPQYDVDLLHLQAVDGDDELDAQQMQTDEYLDYADTTSYPAASNDANLSLASTVPHSTPDQRLVSPERHWIPEALSSSHLRHGSPCTVDAADMMHATYYPSRDSETLNDAGALELSSNESTPSPTQARHLDFAASAVTPHKMEPNGSAMMPCSHFASKSKSTRQATVIDAKSYANQESQRLNSKIESQRLTTSEPPPSTPRKMEADSNMAPGLLVWIPAHMRGRGVSTMRGDLHRM